jgi:hypothetical protein
MSAFQGFDIKLNLSESTSDRAVLNNLGNEPIADDITKFLNNLRNTSVLDVQSSNIFGSVISFAGEKEFVFTNETELKIGNDLRYVGLSNGFDEFSIYSDKDLTLLIETPPTGLYVRSDAVSNSDVLKLVPSRDVVVEDTTTSVYNTGETADVSTNTYNSVVNVYEEIVNSINLGGYLNQIELGIDFFRMKKETSINSVIDFETENKLALSGSITVLDPDGVNNSTISDTAGIFILDITTGNNARIFSTNDNVWSDVGSDLVASTKEIVVGNLVLDEGTRIIRSAGLPAIVSETQVITNFTHFVPVIVNGQEYQLCLK